LKEQRKYSPMQTLQRIGCILGDCAIPVRESALGPVDHMIALQTYCTNLRTIMKEELIGLGIDIDDAPSLANWVDENPERNPLSTMTLTIEGEHYDGVGLVYLDEPGMDEPIISRKKVDPEADKHVPGDNIPLTIKQLLLNLRIRLNGQQLTALDQLDWGQVITVYDVRGSITGRFKRGPVQKIFDPKVLRVTSGNIVQDALRFMQDELPSLTIQVASQTFCDELNIYLQSRGWHLHEIQPVVIHAMQMYEESLQEKAGGLSGKSSGAISATSENEEDAVFSGDDETQLVLEIEDDSTPDGGTELPNISVEVPDDLLPSRFDRLELVSSSLPEKSTVTAIDQYTDGRVTSTEIDLDTFKTAGEIAAETATENTVNSSKEASKIRHNMSLKDEVLAAQKAEKEAENAIKELPTSEAEMHEKDLGKGDNFGLNG
jgi:hypothetical protein